VLRRGRILVLLSAVLVASCAGKSLPNHPDAHRPPKTTSTSTTSTSTTTTTTTTVPLIPVPGPVKLYAPCLPPHGVSTTADGGKVFCADRKSANSKPFGGGRLRWVPPVSG
jgi:hypothetical protein